MFAFTKTQLKLLNKAEQHLTSLWGTGQANFINALLNDCATKEASTALFEFAEMQGSLQAFVESGGASCLSDASESYRRCLRSLRVFNLSKPF